MRAYLTVTGMLFAVIAVAHVSRVVRGSIVQLGSFTIPMWASWIGIVVAGGLAVWAFRLTRRTPGNPNA